MREKGKKQKKPINDSFSLSSPAVPSFLHFSFLAAFPISFSADVFHAVDCTTREGDYFFGGGETVIIHITQSPPGYSNTSYKESYLHQKHDTTIKTHAHEKTVRV